MDLPHQNVCGYLVELDVLEEIADDIFQIGVGIAVAVFLAPHECGLELGEFIRLQFITC